MNKLKEELINHVVKSTQHVVMVDPKTLKPLSGGSGCLIIYKERLFFISVQHVTDKIDKQTALDTGIGNKEGTNIFILPALNYIDQFHIDGLEIGEPTLQKLKSLDICYTEIKGSIEIKQKLKKFGNIIVKPDSKRLVYTNLDDEPTKEKGYSFFGRIGGKLIETELIQTDKLVLGIKYDCKIGPFERFILDKAIVDELDFKGMSGAPIFSETGEIVAFVAHGYLGQNYLFGFSSIDLRKYLDIYIDLNPLSYNDIIKGHYAKEIEEEFSSFDGENNLNKLESIKLDLTMRFDVTESAKEIKEPKFINYSVLYGTNRKLDSESEKINFSNNRDNNLHLGFCEISIPLFHEMGRIERPGWFRKLFFKESPQNYFTVLLNKKTEELEFIQLLKKKIDNSDENDSLLFIHGFNVSFNDAMMRSAQLGYDLNFKGAVTAFSWPSVGTIPGYFADIDSASLSSDYLCDFIKLLIGNNVGKLHIVAHSMGNVVLTKALMQLKIDGILPNTVINQIILAAPDIDKDMFIDQIMPKINGTSRLTLYASDKDNALKLSKQIRTDYIRLGEGGNNIVIIDGLESVDASNVDTNLLGHGYFAETQPLLNDIHMVLLGILPDNRILDAKNKLINGIEKKYWVFRNS